MSDDDNEVDNRFVIEQVNSQKKLENLRIGFRSAV